MAALFSDAHWLLINHLVDYCKHRPVRKVFKFKVRQQKLAGLCKLFEDCLAVGFVNLVIILIEAGQQKQLETPLNVVLAQLELCLDLVDLLVLERSQLEGLAV